MSSRRERRRSKKQNDRLRDEAFEAVANGRLGQARKILERALERAPGNARYWHDLGTILRLDGQGRRAFQAFLHAVELTPHYTPAWSALAELHEAHGDFEDAAHALEQAKDPDARSKIEDWRERGLLPPLVVTAVEVEGEDPDLSRTEAFDWDRIAGELVRGGVARLDRLLTRDECARAIGWNDEPELFEHAVELHDGLGEYRFFAPPLPTLVESLRAEVYFRAARIANEWQRKLGREDRYPRTHEGFLARCHAAGQQRSTPILLRYEEGARNDLHRDLFGKLAFPLQLAVSLGPAGPEDGAEFVLAEAGKRGKVTRLATGPGDAVLFCTRDRLVKVGGVYGLLPVQHGVTSLEAPLRYSLGIPFHDYA